MRKLLTALAVALGIVGFSLLADWLLFGDDPLGVWAFTLAAGFGLGAALAGIVTLFSIVAVKSGRRWQRTLLGVTMILTGALTFALAWMIWLLLGLPMAL